MFIVENRSLGYSSDGPYEALPAPFWALNPQP